MTSSFLITATSTWAHARRNLPLASTGWLAQYDATAARAGPLSLSLQRTAIAKCSLKRRFSKAGF